LLGVPNHVGKLPMDNECSGGFDGLMKIRASLSEYNIEIYAGKHPASARDRQRRGRTHHLVFSVALAAHSSLCSYPGLDNSLADC